MEDINKLLVMNWRKGLLAEEQEVLLPDLLGKLEGIEDGFKRLLPVLMNSRNDAHFNAMLQQLAGTKQITSQSYCDEIGDNLRENFIKPIAEAKILGARVSDIDSLKLFARRVAGICESVNGNKDQLFWMSLRTVLSIFDPVSKKVVQQPGEYAVLLYPFEITLNQISQLCHATTETIRHWSEMTLKLKLQFLEMKHKQMELETTKRNFWVQMAMIAFAVAASYFFMAASDPFNVYHQNEELLGKLKSCEGRQVMPTQK